MSRKQWVLLLVPLVMCACGKETVTTTPDDPVVDVRTYRLTPRTAELTITAVGTFEPEARVLVAAQEEGVVTAVRVREGDSVTAGEVLVELDDREIRARLEEAEAARIDAEARWRRAEALIADGLIPEAEADTARAQYRISEARGEALRTRLSFTRILASADGVVTARHVEVGNLATSRSPLLELAAGEALLLRVPVSELDVVRLRPGDLARITVDALPGVTLEGRIARIFPAADSVSRQVTVEIRVETAPAAVQIGFLARAELVLEERPASLVVPEGAVLRGADVDTFVWKVEGDLARMQPVKVGLRLEGEILIEAGLSVGDEIVVEGLARLRDGARILRAQDEEAES